MNSLASAVPGKAAGNTKAIPVPKRAARPTTLGSQRIMIQNHTRILGRGAQRVRDGLVITELSKPRRKTIARTENKLLWCELRDGLFDQPRPESMEPSFRLFQKQEHQYWISWE
jgi:hypothetical protein